MYSAYKAERPYPRKGHDRSVMVEASGGPSGEAGGSFAVFDGAGDAHASALAAKTFERLSSRRRPPSLEETFQKIQASARRRHNLFVARAAAVHVGHHREIGRTAHGALKQALGWRANIGLTTGTAVRLHRGADGGQTGERTGGQAAMDYVHAGDSSLYMFDHASGELSKLTEDEGNTEGSAGGNTDPSNFIGARDHSLRQIGQLLLPETASIALVTDGIDGPVYQGGASFDTIGNILSEPTDAEQKAGSLVAASSIFDDASAIVIEHQA